MTESNGNGWILKGVTIAAAGVLLGAFSTALWWNFTETVWQGKQIAQLEALKDCR